MKKLKFSIIIFLIAIISVWAQRDPVNYYQDDSRDERQEQLFQMSMDNRVQPCDDFYQYACGNWKTSPQADYQDTLTKLDSQIKQEFVNILQNLNRPNVRQTQISRQVFAYYRSCILNETPETVDYMKSLAKLEPQVNWPISEQRNAVYYRENYDWIQMLATLRKYGLNDVILHELAVPTDLNANMLSIELGRPLSDKNGLNSLRYDVVTGTLRFYMTQHEYHDLWQKIQDLDRQLVELKMQYEQDEEVRFTTVGNLNDTPWLQQYLRVLLDNNNLNLNMELVITNMSYLKAVTELLQRYNAKFICEYLQVKFLSLLNHKQFGADYRDCVTSTRLLLPLGTQWLYEQSHPELQHEITNISFIFTNLKQSFLKILNKNIYNLDQSSMKYFRAKLRNLQLRIGYLSSQNLEAFYGNLTLNANDYYGNRLKIYNYHFAATHRQLNMRLKRNALEFLPLEEYNTAKSLLPYILTRQRAVMVPLSLLQEPYYRPELSQPYLYGSIGFQMARQIMWEFTVADIDVSAYGQIFSYMMDLLLENPLYKLDYDHMTNYHAGESEDVDSAISGLKLAYQAFSDEQVNEDMTRSFFLNFAQMFCGSTPPDYRSSSNVVTNQKIVNMAVKHVEDFSRSFGCNTDHTHGVLYWGSNGV